MDPDGRIYDWMAALILRWLVVWTADRTQVGFMLAPWTLLSGLFHVVPTNSYPNVLKCRCFKLSTDRLIKVSNFVDLPVFQRFGLSTFLGCQHVDLGMFWQLPWRHLHMLYIACSFRSDYRPSKYQSCYRKYWNCNGVLKTDNEVVSRDTISPSSAYLLNRRPCSLPVVLR